ncbi:MAG: hypothetical protein Q8O84_05190 [Nanoarchaeota archaeon]|nr:hypothetical protein [Nanoarchaeota archaeon]
MIRKEDKRGQGLSTNAIILIILGVVVLVMLIVGFTVGWSKLAPWISTNNVQTVVTACNTACSTGSVYDYCNLERTLKADDLPEGINEVKGTCQIFSSDEPVNGVDYSKYGIEACPTITCPSISEA